jgi:hypothetical protein
MRGAWPSAERPGLLQEAGQAGLDIPLVTELVTELRVSAMADCGDGR